MILFLVALAWCGVGLFLLWGINGITILRPVPRSEALPQLPRVSVILAARNEQETLPTTLESLLNLDYPDYEVILVDDDSDDRTGAIADEWMERPASRGKLRVIHNHELPTGWRGKVHAMSLAEQAATGEWVLATDADVVCEPSLLRQAMILALQKGARLLSLTPELDMQSLAEKVVMPAFGFFLFMLFPPRLVNHPNSGRALAAGAFLLMRRKDLASLGGYPRLRNTLVEDLRMSEMFKHNGHRIYLAVTRGLFRTRMYKNWREVFEGLTRSAWEGADRSIWKVLGALIVGNALAVLPWVSLATLLLVHAFAGTLPVGDPTLLAGAATALSVIIYCPIILFAGLSPLYALTLPFASLFYSAVAVTSALFSLTGPGVRWKGRWYHSPSS
ncbi:MAG: glycosyltransferase [Acidobacteria bacterium]|nr:glycosyltransferase [Acidobacteriota bacterium]